MANNYYDQTGVLVFKGKMVVTPIILALFSVFNLDCNFPGDKMNDDGSIKDGEAYIGDIAQDNSTSLSSIASCIADEAENLGI